MRFFKTLVLLVAATALGTPQGLFAQAKDQVSVGIKFDVDRLTMFWEQEETEFLEQELAKYLIQEVFAKDPFNVWSVSADEHPDHFKMIFGVLEEDGSLKFVLRLPQSERADGLSNTFKGTWLSLGEFMSHRLMLHDEALEKLKVALTAHLRRHSTELKSFMIEAVALSNSRSQFIDNPVTSELELVLPLQWDQYPGLRTAEFVIVCQQAEVGQVTLVSAGRGRAAEYVSDAHGAFPAIVTKPTRQRGSGTDKPVEPDHWDTVRKFEPGSIYLSRSSSAVDGFLSTQQ